MEAEQQRLMGRPASSLYEAATERVDRWASLYEAATERAVSAELRAISAEARVRELVERVKDLEEIVAHWKRFLAKRAAES